MDSRFSETIAIFGPQVTIWTQESLSQLQSALLLNPHLKFIKKALIELPSLWPTIEKYFQPRSSSHESLIQLRDFAQGNKIPNEKTFSNSYLAPLTIVDHVVHLVQLAEELRLEQGGKNDSLEIPVFRAAQGFCIGFLSAGALCSSSKWAEIEINASNALRIAACIGLIIDADVAQGSATAVTARWKTNSERAYLEFSMETHPEASFEFFKSHS